VEYVYNNRNRIIKFVAIRDIDTGEEFTVNYNGNIHDKSPVWFDVE